MISSGHSARPPTKICGAWARPLPVGSEKRRATRSSRRMFSAFWLKAREVLSRSVPSFCRRTAVGQAAGVPSRPRVTNSQVR